MGILELAARTALAHPGPGTGQNGLRGDGQVIEEGILIMPAGERVTGDEGGEEREFARALSSMGGGWAVFEVFVGIGLGCQGGVAPVRVLVWSCKRDV